MTEHPEQYDEPTEDDRERMRYAHQDALRVIESQKDGGDALDAKAQQLLGMALLGLPAAAGLATFLVDRVPPSAPFALRLVVLLSIILGGALNLLAVGTLADAYVGLRKRQTRALVPEPPWLAKQAINAEQPVWKYHVAIVLAAETAYAHNDREMQDVVRLRRRAVWTLIATAGVYFIAAATMMGAILFA